MIVGVGVVVGLDFESSWRFYFFGKWEAVGCFSILVIVLLRVDAKRRIIALWISSIFCCIVRGLLFVVLIGVFAKEVENGRLLFGLSFLFHSSSSLAYQCRECFVQLTQWSFCSSFSIRDSREISCVSRGVVPLKNSWVSYSKLLGWEM